MKRIFRSIIALLACVTTECSCAYAADSDPYRPLFASAPLLGSTPTATVAAPPHNDWLERRTSNLVITAGFMAAFLGVENKPQYRIKGMSRQAQVVAGLATMGAGITWKLDLEHERPR